MAQSFDCPNCGGALQYDGGGSTATCGYCHSTVEVPASIRRAAVMSSAGASFKALPALVRYAIVFFVLIITVPTCIGLAGSLLGILAGVGAPILVAILQLLGQ
jgi:hypothetical protein